MGLIWPQGCSLPIPVSESGVGGLGKGGTRSWELGEDKVWAGFHGGP
jgi:hypothetical protein